MRDIARWRVRPGEKVHLSGRDPASTDGALGDRTVSQVLLGSLEKMDPQYPDPPPLEVPPGTI